MFKGSVGRKNRVIRLNDGTRHLGGWVDGELEFRLLAVVGRQALHEECTEARASSTTERVEDKEALKTTAVVCQTADLVHYGVDEFLANSIVPTGI